MRVRSGLPAVLITFLVPAVAITKAQEPAPLPVVGADTEIIVVTAPGPAPWKVSKDDHVLWIYAYPGVVPLTLEWDSARLERQLARSQEFLAVPQLDLGSRVARAPLTLPEGSRLGDVLPAEAYADYLALKADLFPGSDMLEEFQPYFVGSALQSALYRRSGLKEGSQILRQINALAREQRGLRRTRIEVRPSRAERKALRTMLEAASADVSAEQGLACFTRAIANVKRDLGILQERANAWADGHVAEMSRLQTSREEEAYCAFYIPDSAERDVAERLGTEMWERWHAAVDLALSRNESTVAILDMGLLVEDRESGPLQMLRDRGYSVEKP